ncbi:MAG: hypothetical protein MN733_37435 [Nitrososphaera sp.]|nr:hypothetical protein [Nitrososphaera sp.]
MPKWAYQLEQWGVDFIVTVEEVPAACPQCYAPMQMYDVEFLDDGTIGGALNLQQLADNRHPVLVEIVCPQEHIVCREMARILHLHEFAPSRAQESPEIGKIRTIYAQLQKRLPGLQSPSTELLEKSFLPGCLVQPDVWVSDKASVSPTVKFVPPVLIGGESQVNDHAICGPFVMLIDSTVEAGDLVSKIAMVDNQIFTVGV